MAIPNSTLVKFVNGKPTIDFNRGGSHFLAWHSALMGSAMPD